MVAGHRIPGAEADVLEALLASSQPLLVEDVRDLLPGRRRAHTTVATLLARLVERGLVIKEPDPRGNRYRPLGSHEDLAVAALTRVLEGLDDPAGALIEFIDRLPTSSPLRRRLRRRLAGGGGGR